MPTIFESKARLLSKLAIILLTASTVLLYVQVRQSRGCAENVKYKLVTVESTIEYVLTEAVQRGTLDRAEFLGQFAIVVILDVRGCATCIASEVNALNAYWDQLKGHTQVYFGGDAADYLREREILFDYRSFLSMEETVGSDLGPINPVSVLFANDQILDIRVSTPTNLFHEELASAW